MIFLCVGRDGEEYYIWSGLIYKLVRYFDHNDYLLILEHQSND